MQFLWFAFIIATLCKVVYGSDWWRTYTEDELWTQGYSYVTMASLHDPGYFTEEFYFDIAFVIDESQHMKDTDYKPMFQGLQQYVNMFKYFGWNGDNDHCSSNVPPNWKGWTCFAVWRCGNVKDAAVHFKDTPTDISKISKLLEPPKKFHSPAQTASCLQQAMKMFKKENGDRPKNNKERANILFFVTECKSKRHDAAVRDNLRKLSRYTVGTFVICSQGPNDKDMIEEGPFALTSTLDFELQKWSGFGSFLHLLSDHVSTVSLVRIVDCRFRMETTPCIYDTDTSVCSRQQLAFVMIKSGQYGKPCPQNRTQVCDATECDCEKNEWRVSKMCDVWCGQGVETQTRDISQNPTCDSLRTVTCQQPDCTTTTEETTTTTTLEPTTTKITTPKPTTTKTTTPNLTSTTKIVTSNPTTTKVATTKLTTSKIVTPEPTTIRITTQESTTTKSTTLEQTATKITTPEPTTTKVTTPEATTTKITTLEPTTSKVTTAEPTTTKITTPEPTTPKITTPEPTTTKITTLEPTTTKVTTAEPTTVTTTTAKPKTTTTTTAKQTVSTTTETATTKETITLKTVIMPQTRIPAPNKATTTNVVAVVETFLPSSVNLTNIAKRESVQMQMEKSASNKNMSEKGKIT